MKKTIAYFHTTATASSTRKINGVYHAARERCWNVLRFDIRTAAQVRETLAYWKPDGCIIDAAADNVRIPLEAFSRVRHVCLDCNPALHAKQESCIVQDANAVAECAVEELTQHHRKSYAYAAWPERQFWSLQRGRAFRAAVSRRNLSVSVFRPHSASRSLASVRESLVGWLETLDLPAGIFTATDTLSVLVQEVAAECGLRIPEDISVIGVDNEEFTCETARPMISSIDPGFETAGEQSVDMLDRLMHMRKPHPLIETFKTPSVIRRGSTRLSNHHDATVTGALDYIREHATEGIGASDVLALFKCSRCLAERRFRAVARRSVLDEIHAVQIEAAQKLIRRPFQKLDAIPRLCGYDSTPFFQKLFKRSTGYTMSEWRELGQVPKS